MVGWFWRLFSCLLFCPFFEDGWLIPEAFRAWLFMLCVRFRRQEVSPVSRGVP
jgi:flagellar biosynthesis protein FliR